MKWLMTLLIISLISMGGYFYLNHEIHQGEKQIAWGEQQIAKGEKQLRDGKVKLAAGKAIHRPLALVPFAALSSITPEGAGIFHYTKKQVDKVGKKIKHGEKQVAAGEKQLKSGKQQLADGKKNTGHS